jgi:hypothetical protein
MTGERESGGPPARRSRFWAAAVLALHAGLVVFLLTAHAVLGPRFFRHVLPGQVYETPFITDVVAASRFVHESPALAWGGAALLLAADAALYLFLRRRGETALHRTWATLVALFLVCLLGVTYGAYIGFHAEHARNAVTLE